MGAGLSIVGLAEFLDGIGLIDAFIVGLAIELDVLGVGTGAAGTAAESIILYWEITNAGIIAATGSGTVLGGSVIGGTVGGILSLLSSKLNPKSNLEILKRLNFWEDINVSNPLNSPHILENVKQKLQKECRNTNGLGSFGKCKRRKKKYYIEQFGWDGQTKTF